MRPRPLRNHPTATFLLLAGFVLSCALMARAVDELAPEDGLPVTRFALVGESMQRVLLALPAPASVYLAGADAELPRPRETDPVVFRYELVVDLAGGRPAVVFVSFEPGTYEVGSVTVAFDEVVPLDAVIDAVGLDHRRERRRVESDDVDLWVTDEIDPRGGAAVVVFPTLGLEAVQIAGMPNTVLDFEERSTVLVDSVDDHVRALFPATVARCLAALPEAIELSSRLNPFYLRGDFDGDGAADRAFLVRRRGDEGIAVCLGAKPVPILLGAGTAFHGLTNLDFDRWLVFDRGAVEKGAGEETVPVLEGDALMVLWNDSASALIHLDDGSFAWYQQGD